MSKTRVLFMAEDVTLAHSSRAYVLASQIDPERYEIHFATSSRSRFLINTPDIIYHEIQTLDPEVFIERLKKGQPIYSVDELSCSTEADLALLREVLPEVVIGDFRLSLGISSVLADTPYVALTNAHWSPYSTQAFPIPDLWFSRIISTKVSRFLFPLLEPVIFWYHARAFNKVRRAHGLLPVGNLKEVYTHSTWSLFTDLPIIAPTRKLTKNQRYIGPVIWSPEIAAPEWWSLLSEESTIIYVTMGSSGDISILRNILEAGRETSCITLVATAGRVQIESEPGIYTADYLPGIEVISRASLVICSGGSATAYQALSLGVPILGIPSNADQFFTMESIERNRAGLLLRPAEASVKQLNKYIDILLSDDIFKLSAGQLATEVTRYNSSIIFPAFLEEITSSGEPRSS